MKEFNYFWNIFLVIVFVSSVVYLGYQLRDFTLDGRDCQSQPFDWGANKVVETDNDHDTMDCACLLYNKGGYGLDKNYYFSNDNENNRLIPKKVYKIQTVNLSVLNSSRFSRNNS